MASCSKRKLKRSTKYFQIFNCDKTCTLDQVKSLLCSVDSKVDFKIEVVKQPFNLRSVSTLVEKTIPGLRMDYAVFMIHPNDSLAFTEESSYRKIYEALKRRTNSSGDKVLIVIGGDKKYENKEEEQNDFLSRSALQIIKGQFLKEFIDGRKSFIFSWDDHHRPIHEEALLHYFDQSKRGQKFERQPVRHAQPMKNVQAKTPIASKESADGGQRKTSDNTPIASKESADGRPRKTSDNTPIASKESADGGPRKTSDNTSIASKESADGGQRKSSNNTPFGPPLQPEVNDFTGSDTATSLGAGGTRTVHPESEPVLLKAYLNYGRISYRDEDISPREPGWRPTEKQLSDLRNDCKSIPVATVTFVRSGIRGVQYTVEEVKPNKTSSSGKYCRLL